MIIKKSQIVTASDCAFNLKIAAESLEKYLMACRAENQDIDPMTMDVENISDKLWKIEFEIGRINEALGFEFTSTKLSEKCGVNRSRIRQLAPKMAQQGLAYKKGRDWRFNAAAVKFVLDQAGAGAPRQYGRNI